MDAWSLRGATDEMRKKAAGLKARRYIYTLRHLVTKLRLAAGWATSNVTWPSFCGSGLVAARDFAFYYVYFEGGAAGGGPRRQIESVSGAEL
jgi:hypothetical protein